MPQKTDSFKIILLIAVLNVAIKYCSAQLGGNTAPPTTSAAKYSPIILPKDVKKINDEDAYTSYAVFNDDKAVYIKLYITDSLQKRKVLQNGMEIWVDVKGKRNKGTGILFPLSAGGNNYPGGGNRLAAGGPPSFSQTGVNRKIADTSLPVLIEKRQEMELKGFAGDINGKQLISNAAGVSVALYLSGDTLLYQASVPFNTIGILATADKPVSIGIIEKGVDLPGFGDMGGGPGGDEGGGPPGGGDGGPPPGGPPPGDMRDGGIDYRRLFETNTIWYKLKLHV